MAFPGVDIIEIKRFAEACERRPKLFERLFSQEERGELECKGMQSRAGRFAAKEAVLKSLGTGLSGLAWHDIEVLTNSRGEPIVRLSDRAREIALARGGNEVRVSISHDRERAIAFAILV